MIQLGTAGAPTWWPGCSNAPENNISKEHVSELQLEHNDSSTLPRLCHLDYGSELPSKVRKLGRRRRPPGSSAGNSEPLLLTRCCGRPICDCPSCLTSNPRLARYNPCLACLGGVGAVGTRKLQGQHPVASNVDGAVTVRDEDGASETDGEAAKASGVPSSPSEGPGPPEPDVQVIGPYAGLEANKPPYESTEPTDSNQEILHLTIRPNKCNPTAKSRNAGADLCSTSTRVCHGACEVKVRIRRRWRKQYEHTALIWYFYFTFYFIVSRDIITQ